MINFLASLFMLLAFAQVSVQGQTTSKTSANHPKIMNVSPADGKYAQPGNTNTQDADTLSPETKLPQPHIIIADPPPAVVPAPWTLYEKISWAANIVLAMLGYAGILLAIGLLKKIERQTHCAETAAQAAMEAAKAVLINAQAHLNSERPWILIRVDPAQNVENNFRIMATNRGHSPAQILSSTERISLAADEQHLPNEPEYAKEASGLQPAQNILLPGESMVILPFSRNDMKWVCKTEQSLRRVERKQDTVFIYGKIIYRNLLASSEAQTYHTQWCCSYIHGVSSSNLIIAGPQEYNKIA
jgi:hypothetical protein